MNETAKKFKENLELGWDYAIEELKKETYHYDILFLCKIYWKGYETVGYKQSLDPDDGLCFAIREFAVNKILEVLNNEN